MTDEGPDRAGPEQKLQTIRWHLLEAAQLLDEAEVQVRLEQALFKLLGPFATSYTQTRVMESIREKKALGEVLVKHLQETVGTTNADDAPRIPIFVEGGSTLAWAVQPLVEETHSVLRSRLRVVTNNLVVRMALDRSPTEPKLLPYPSNAKYWATSPFPEDINEIWASQDKVKVAYARLHKRLNACRELFITCSRLSLTEGPFCGSVSHTLFKHVAFCVPNPKINVLLDGSKILFGKPAVDKERKTCRQLFRPTDAWDQHGARSPYLAAFGKNANEQDWKSVLGQGSFELWVSRPDFGGGERSSHETQRLIEILQDMEWSESDNPGDLYGARIREAAQEAGLKIEDEEVSVDGRPIVVYRMRPG